MRTKGEIASEDYQGNYNCAQSTFALFAEKYGLDQQTAFRIGAGLGGGCHFGGTCGAVTAGCGVIGLKYGHTEPDPEKYGECRAKVREFVEKFVEEFGSIECSCLLGIDMAQPGGRDQAKEQGLFDTRCRGLVKFAVDILDELGY